MMEGSEDLAAEEYWLSEQHRLPVSGGGFACHLIFLDQGAEIYSTCPGGLSLEMI